jgi:hypothetical protein
MHCKKNYQKKGVMMESKKKSRFSKVLGLTLTSLVLSQAVVQCTPKPLPKVSEVPNNQAAIDAAIKRLERAKEGLEGMKYMANDEAMSQETQSWMDYQGDIRKEADVNSRIHQIQKEIDELKARKARLMK